MEVTKISIWALVGFFVGYIIIHTLIGWYKNYLEKTLTTPTEEDKKMIKFLTHAFKWFPFVYVIFVIICFYMM